MKQVDFLKKQDFNKDLPLPGQEPLPDGAGGRGESHEDNTHGRRREDSVAFVCVLARAQPTAAVQLHKNIFERAK